MNYETDMQIDETSLDIEWLEQSAKMMRYIRYAAEASRELDKAKENLDITQAEIDLQARSNPEKFGLEKVTDTAVKSAILTDKRYQEASQVILEAKYESDMAKGAVRAMEQRKDALENLVRLHGQQYFSGPKVPRDLSEERQKRQENVDQKVASRLKRTR